jgi:hypothetical protein
MLVRKFSAEITRLNQEIVDMRELKEQTVIFYQK